MGTPRCRHRLLGRMSLAGLVAASLFLTAPSSLPVHSAAKGPPALQLDYYPRGSGVLTLDPALVTSADDAETMMLVNANLVHILPSGKVAPDLAATWTVSRNHLVYSFTIRSNARFSNGHFVSAQDAAFSIERSLAPSTGSPVAATYLELIRGADAFHAGKTKTLSGLRVLGRRVLQITITKPVAYFLDALSYPTGDVLDPAVVAGKPIGTPDPTTNVYKDNYLTSTCAGNQGAGPFMFVCRNRTSISSFYRPHKAPNYTLIANPSYYGRKPHIAIQLPVLASDNAGYRAYLANQLAVYDFAPGDPHFGRWTGKKELHQYASAVVVYLVPNTHLPPFDNVHCRLAVAYAIDRSTLSHNVQHGITRPSYTVVPKGMLGYYPGNDNPHYNPSRARSELARCPGRTVPFALTYPTLFQNHAAATATMLSAVGMNVKLNPVSPNEWGKIVNRTLDKTRTQLVEDSWAADYPDPQDYCSLLLRSGQPYDIGGWHNATYDRLVDRADVTLDRKKRARLYRQAQHLALSQGAFISLSNVLAFALVKPYVHGLVGSEAYVDLMPKSLDWSKVSISKH